MDENTNEVEVEISDDDLDAFDESWAEDESEDLTDDGDEGNEDSDEPVDDGEPDQDEDGNPEPDHDEEPSEDSDEAEKPGEQNEEGHQLFEINYLGNREQLTLEQMTELAQKGRDYDHVREERDRIKGESSKHLAFLQDLADRAGLTIDEQIDKTRALWLMNDEYDKGNEISESEALLRVQRAKNEPEQPKDEQKPENQDYTVQINKFLAVYPDVKSTDIPKEVWDRAMAMGGDLLGAYQTYEIAKLKEENKKIKQSAQNERNAQRSTGPLKTSGASRKKDDFDEGWDSDL